MERRDGAVRSFTLKELKLAVINEDLDTLKILSACTPRYETFEEAKELVKYIEKAIELLNMEKNEISKKMSEIRKLQKFNQENHQNICDFKY